MISFISSLEVINVILSDPNIFLGTAASVADAAALNLNVIKTPLANGWSTFPIKDNSVLVLKFSNGSKSIPKNPLDCRILCKKVFDNSILAEEWLAKALRSFETCVLVNGNPWGNLFSSLESPTTFNESFKVMPEFPFLCQILIHHAENKTILHWKCYIESFYTDIMLK